VCVHDACFRRAAQPVSDGPWQPSATLPQLQLTAKVRQAVRQYMHEHHVLEVVTPALSQAAATDPHVASVAVQLDEPASTSARYLHTSPEFPMKRLLAAYRCDMYQMAVVFRAGELGRYHNPEFSLLEWYRMAFDHHALMQDVEHLLIRLCAEAEVTWHPAQYVTYGDAVEAVTGEPLAKLSVATIERVFTQHKRSWPKNLVSDRNAAFDLLIDEFVLPGFPTDRATFLIDYPASQAALARVATNAAGEAVAERFELYWGVVELANGFHELTDAAEQRGRFLDDLQTRQAMGLPSVVLDDRLLDALAHGLPDCAGVALGLDRLMMVLSGASHIRDVLAFEIDRA